LAKKAGYFFETSPYRFKKKGGNQVKNPIWQAGNAVAVIAPDNQLLLPCYHRRAFGFPIDNNLYELWNSAEVRETRALQGRLETC
jgi:hypothetical protein